MSTGPDNLPPFRPQPLSAAPAVRPPPRYFEFASPSSNVERNRNGVSAQTIRQLVRQHGNNILIGFDLGRLNPEAVRGGNIQDAIPQQQREAFRVARELGVRLHAYLGGPFGPTGSSFEQGEASFMAESARRVGINTNRGGWQNEWNSHGWKEATRRQLAVVRQLGFESFELDNLQRDARINAATRRDDAANGDTPYGNGPLATAAYVDLFREVAGWGGPDRLMMKNLGTGVLRGVEQAMTNGQLRRGNFADFMISEEGYRNQWPAIERSAAGMGIQLARSHNTHDYATSQAYNVAAMRVATQPQPYSPIHTPRPAQLTLQPVLHPVQGHDAPSSAWRFNTPPAPQNALHATPRGDQQGAAWNLPKSSDVPPPRQRPT